MNDQQISVHNDLDENGNPAGGGVLGVGLRIDWQNGPLAFDGQRREPNGTFVETVIRAAQQRLVHYQDTKFKCDENADAIDALQQALDACARRTAGREERGVEGTHSV